MMHELDVWHLAVALVPLSIYLLAIGFINLSRHATVVNGGKDTMALGLGISGLVLVGPLKLLLPTAAAFRPGWFIWPLLLALYGLGLVLMLLLRRPRLVIYNIAVDELRPVLAKVLVQLDHESRWAGDCLYLPSLGVQLQVEATLLTRNVQLAAAGGSQSLDGWARLERALRAALINQPGRRNFFGLNLVVAGLILLVTLALSVAIGSGRLAAADDWRQWIPQPHTLEAARTLASQPRAWP